MISLTRAGLAASCGLALWAIVHLLEPTFPDALRASIAFLALTWGVGGGVVYPIRHRLHRIEYVVVGLVTGIAATPALFDLSGRLDLDWIVVPAVFGLAGIWALAIRDVRRPCLSERRDTIALLVVAASVFLVASVVAFPRVSGRSGLDVYGDYDVHDMTYYAAIAGELTHTRPPQSPFMSGHTLVYSYYPHLLLAVVADAARVDVLRMSLQWAWPLFAFVSSAITWLLCRRLGSRVFASVTTAFVFGAEGLAGLLAWRWPDAVSIDPLVWSSAFLAPSATWLYYNTWGPALVVMVGALYAFARLHESRGWAVIAALCTAVLPLFKIFAYVVIVPTMCATALVLWRRHTAAARRLPLTIVLSVAGSLPWLLPIVMQRDESNSYMTLAWLALPKRMLMKLHLTPTLTGIAERVSRGSATAWIVLSIALIIFLVGGMGFRCLGARSLWRGLRGRLDVDAPVAWTSLAWLVLVATLMPFVISVEPPPNGVQPYVAGLLFAWPFAVRALIGIDRVVRWRGALTAVVFAVSAVPTWHYVASTAHPTSGPWVSLPAGEQAIVDALAATDPRNVVVLHDRPDQPSLISILARRRIVVAWTDTVGWADRTETNRRAADLEAFFAGRLDADGAQALYARYHVTHVVTREGQDQVRADVIARLRLVASGRTARLFEVPTD